MRWELWLGSVLAVLAGLWWFHGWSYEQGARDCRDATQAAALTATQATLVDAGKQNVKDAQLGLDSTNAVELERKASAKRQDRINTAPLAPQPVGGPDAPACPDVLGPAFWRLYDDPAAGDPAPAPASSAAGRVPG